MTRNENLTVGASGRFPAAPQARNLNLGSLSERSEFRSPSNRDWGKGTLTMSTPGRQFLGPFLIRNKRTSSCAGRA